MRRLSWMVGAAWLALAPSGCEDFFTRQADLREDLAMTASGDMTTLADLAHPSDLATPLDMTAPDLMIPLSSYTKDEFMLISVSPDARVRLTRSKDGTSIKCFLQRNNTWDSPCFFNMPGSDILTKKIFWLVEFLPNSKILLGYDDGSPGLTVRSIDTFDIVHIDKPIDLGINGGDEVHSMFLAHDQRHVILEICNGPNTCHIQSVSVP